MITPNAVDLQSTAHPLARECWHHLTQATNLHTAFHRLAYAMRDQLGCDNRTTAQCPR